MPYPLIRKFFFSLDAETARRMGVMGVDRVACLMAKPVTPCRVNVMGLKFPNPVGLAAGLNNGDHIDSLAKLGFGFLRNRHHHAAPADGNPKPRLFRIPVDELLKAIRNGEPWLAYSHGELDDLLMKGNGSCLIPIGHSLNCSGTGRTMDGCPEVTIRGRANASGRGTRPAAKRNGQRRENHIDGGSFEVEQFERVHRYYPQARSMAFMS